MDQLKDLLLKKWDIGELNHFYILRAPYQEKSPETFLKNWISDFLAQIFVREKGLTMDQALHLVESQNHADILILSPEGQKDYAVDDFSSFLRFIQLASFELKHRFVIITNAHKITHVVSNKLLKSLEEPGENITIFFLNPQNKELLQTVESRAQKLRPIPQYDAPLTNFHSSLKEAIYEENQYNQDLKQVIKQFIDEKAPLHEVLDKIKTTQETFEQDFLKLILESECNTESGYLQKEALLNLMKWNHKSKELHNYQNERLFELFQYAQKYQ